MCQRFAKYLSQGPDLQLHSVYSNRRLSILFAHDPVFHLITVSLTTVNIFKFSFMGLCASNALFRTTYSALTPEVTVRVNTARGQSVLGENNAAQGSTGRDPWFSTFAHLFPSTVQNSKHQFGPSAARFATEYLPQFSLCEPSHSRILAYFRDR
jgi:hypothetical protein